MTKDDIKLTAQHHNGIIARVLRNERGTTREFDTIVITRPGTIHEEIEVTIDQARAIAMALQKLDEQNEFIRQLRS